LLEKPIDANQDWTAGYKADFMFGPDANVLATQSSGTTSDFCIKQAYVALHAPVGNGIDFKLGVWDSFIGYEVTDSINNPNSTRSYGYSIEPSTHTGIQGAYQFTETFSTIVGVADTFGPKINQRANPPQAESYKTYLGSLTLTAPKNWGFLAGSTLSGCVINGYNSNAHGGAGADQTSWYIGGTMNTPLNGFKLGAAYDYAGLSSQPLTGGAYANVVALYASYQATEKLSLYARGEYATSDALT
ncbi:MAG: outer membrane beta-barrel protein, partial [Verrucomicrobia bacterium]|nr:outer membrane beta-barrel protein [Verrucomicrobiota bacterium]